MRDPKVPKTEAECSDTMKGPKDPKVIGAAKQAVRLGVASIVLMLGSTTTVLAQMPSPECDLPPSGRVVNPTRVCFEVSPEHDTLDSYALDIYDDGDQLVNTIDVGKPADQTTPDGSRWVIWDQLNVQPTAFGPNYYTRIRGIGNGVSGPSSATSNTFDRAPGGPSRPPRIVRGFQWLGKGVWAGLKGSGRGLASIHHVIR